MNKQRMNGSPLNPGLHMHIGLWFTTLHVVPWPHELGQGSTHLLFSQARFVAQSVLTVHSGLQPGGASI